MTSTLARFRLPAPHLYLIAGASLGGLLFLRHVSSSLRADKFKTLKSPRETSLLGLSEDELKNLPYPPDALPGARDVDSPYGSIRVYEWGPEDGERILLIHGISTPSIALADLAHKLVEKGCRVMLFGMWAFLRRSCINVQRSFQNTVNTAPQNHMLAVHQCIFTEFPFHSPIHIPPSPPRIDKTTY